MSNNSIKITKDDIVSVDKDKILIKPSTSITIKKDDTPRLSSSPGKAYIVRNDLATIKRNDDIPQWFQDQIDNTIESSTLANSVSSLENSFNNYSNGTTMQIGYLQQADAQLAYDISTTKTSADNNTAGISNLNVTKVSESQAIAIADTSIAAWSSGAGSAWFNQKVSTVSNVAYSAAKSTSTLTTSFNSQQDKLNTIVGDINTLQAQVDGKIETWFGQHNVIDSAGDLIETAEPYATWVANNEINVHTGDIYVKTETNVTTGKEDIIASYSFTVDASIDKYNWFLRTDDIATQALQAALDAQQAADGKIVTYYQTFPPVDASDGDLWLDSDDDNKMYRYNVDTWTVVSDERIQANVDIISEAIVDMNGTATAKYGVTVGAQNSVSGFVIGANNESSNFKIFADNFTLANNTGSDVGAPFVIDTTTNEIKFTGNVTFAGTPGYTALQPGSAANDINTNVTKINGGAVEANSLNANTIIANGNITSPNITGGTIEGTTINGVNIIGSVIKSSWIDYTSTGHLTDWAYFTKATVPSQYKANFAHNADGTITEDSNGYVRLPTLKPVTLNMKTDSPYSDKGNKSYTHVTVLDIYPYNKYTINTEQRVIKQKDNYFTILNKTELASVWSSMALCNGINQYVQYMGQSVTVSFMDGSRTISSVSANARWGYGIYASPGWGTSYVSDNGVNYEIFISDNTCLDTKYIKINVLSGQVLKSDVSTSLEVKVCCGWYSRYERAYIGIDKVTTPLMQVN